MIRFENVGMRYGMGPEVLRDVSFHLAPGSFHFLTGPSGAGKTSLLKLMFLANRPSRGLITMFDKDVATLPRGELGRGHGPEQSVVFRRNPAKEGGSLTRL